MKQKNEIGITLVALVITIIILLILAGVSIGILINNSLLDRAKIAKEIYKNIQSLEDETLTGYETTIEDMGITTSREEISSQGNPTGTVISYMGTIEPKGYLFCDGAEYNISDYKNLAEQIKTNFGSYNYFGGDGETTFAVPNLQGEFLRGYSEDASKSVTTNVKTSSVGKHQDATYNLAINKDQWDDLWMQGDSGVATAGWNFDLVRKGTNSTGVTMNASKTTWSGSGITQYVARPTNTAVLYCIKY